MATLTEILQKYKTSEMPTLGMGEDADIIVAPSNRNIDTLKTELEKVKQENKKYFQACFGAVGILFVVSLVILFQNIHKEVEMKLLLAFIEGIVALLVNKMLKLWSEKNDTELLLAIATNTEGGALQTVIDILANRLKHPSALKEESKAFTSKKE